MALEGTRHGRRGPIITVGKGGLDGQMGHGVVLRRTRILRLSISGRYEWPDAQQHHKADYKNQALKAVVVSMLGSSRLCEK